MTTYNTGNPVPSADTRDRYDNSQAFDEAVNSEEPFFVDRLGVNRKTWSGLESDFTERLASLGYTSAGPYAGGLVLTRYDEYVAVSAETTGVQAGFYRPGPNAETPLTLTGDWAIDSQVLVWMGETVKSVNGVPPDNAGDINITPQDVGALPVGATAADSALLGGRPPEDYLIGNSHVLTVGWEASREMIGDGYAATDGQLLSRATYPDVAAAIIAGKVPVVDDATWLADPTQRGKFSLGNGTTTFRLPDWNGKFGGSLGAVFQRGDGLLSAGETGLIQRDQLQGFGVATRTTYDATQAVPIDGNNSNGFAGVASGLPPVKYARTGRTGLTGQYDLFGNDGTNGDPRFGSETRPLSVTGCWVIKLFGAVVNVGSADAAQLASDYANLAGALQALNSQIDFTIIYPNGGGETSPANVTTNSRYVEPNPFPGYRVLCQAEILFNGVWVETGWFATQASVGGGVRATQLSDGNVVVRTGVSGLMYGGQISGSPADYSIASPYTTPSPCRVKVWKVKGAIA